MNIGKSKNHNSNYLARVIELKKIIPHPNADKLQLAIVDFQNIVVGLGAKVGDKYVYFPVESKISDKLLSYTNSYRHGNLNKDVNSEGFFEDNGRVRAVKLRGEYSLGYLIPLKEVEDCYGVELGGEIGNDFDMIGDEMVVEKYCVPVKNNGLGNGVAKGKKPRISRIVEGQVHLHVDTENLRREIYRLKPEDEISITYKLHGTSFWVSNVLGKRKLNVIDKIARMFGAKIKDTQYDFFYGSRKVVKNQYETQDKKDFYGYDLWCDIKNELKDFMPKGISIYGECVGYTKNGGAIQGGYDYGCRPGENKIFIYRITQTNEEGMVTEFSTKQINEFCDYNGLNSVPLFFRGRLDDIIPYEVTMDIEDWRGKIIKHLEAQYNDKDCYMCTNNVPEEGVVIRKESLIGFEAYKLKSPRFLDYETKQLDSGEVDIESVN